MRKQGEKQKKKKMRGRGGRRMDKNKKEEKR